MVRPEKLLSRILNGETANISFRDLIHMLECMGFELVRIRGSHHMLDHPGVCQELNLQPDRNGQAKAYQVRQVAQVVREYDLGKEIRR